LDQGACSGDAGHASADDGDFECHALDSTRCLELWEFGKTQGQQKGLGATPRFALYVVRTKPLLLAFLLG